MQHNVERKTRPPATPVEFICNLVSLPNCISKIALAIMSVKRGAVRLVTLVEMFCILIGVAHVARNLQLLSSRIKDNCQESKQHIPGRLLTCNVQRSRLDHNGNERKGK